MAPVHIKLFLALVFLVGVGFCQNATNTTGAPATPTVATPAPASTTTSTPRPSVTNSLFNMVAAAHMGFQQACKFGLTAISSFLQQIAAHKKF